MHLSSKGLRWRSSSSRGGIVCTSLPTTGMPKSIAVVSSPYVPSNSQPSIRRVGCSSSSPWRRWGVARGARGKSVISDEQMGRSITGWYAPIFHTRDRHAAGPARTHPTSRRRGPTLPTGRSHPPSFRRQLAPLQVHLPRRIGTRRRHAAASAARATVATRPSGDIGRIDAARARWWETLVSCARSAASRTRSKGATSSTGPDIRPGRVRSPCASHCWAHYTARAHQNA